MGITEFDARRYVHVASKLKTLSAEKCSSEEDGSPHFNGRIILDQDRVVAGVVSCPILPGMTATAHITTGSQNLLRYLTRSVYMAIEQAFSKS